MKGETPASDFEKYTKKDLMEKCASLTNQKEDKKDRVAKQAKVIQQFIELRPLTFEEKLLMSLSVYEKVEIKDGEETVKITTNIPSGWMTQQAATVEEGLNKLLFLI